MLSELEDQPDRRCTETIDFKTAKDINNDLVGILRALSEVTMCTEIGEEIKRRYYSYMMITAFHLEIRLC
jgi:hypothetical protein